MALLWVVNTLFDLFLLQNIDIHMHEKVLQFRGDLYFINIWCKKICVDSIIKVKAVVFPVFLCAAQGYGAKGLNEYHFSLEVFLPVKPEVCASLFKKKKGKKFQTGYILFGSPHVCFLFSDHVQVCYKSTQRQVNISVQKEERGWWERLCVQERKPVFLAPDFDRWLDESDAELEIKAKVGFKFSRRWNLSFDNL